MKLTPIISIVAVAFAATTIMPSGTSAAAERPAIDLAKWTPPDIRELGEDAFATAVKYGRALVTDTANQLGPAVPDPAKRYSGNNLTCQNCHLQAGTQVYAMPFVGVWGQFPQYRGREGEVGTLEDRINGCMERSMNGRPLAPGSSEMKAFLAYAKWLSTGTPDGARIVGAGTLAFKEPARAADRQHGAEVYAQICAACHGEKGEGQRGEGTARYQFPPLWGDDSYNDGAGMSRLLAAAAFIKSNMPFGTTFDAPALADDDAYDVAAYVNSQSRPHKANLDRDFPNRLQKPVDTPYGPYIDGFAAEQHKYGPYEPIRAKLKELANEALRRRQ